MNPADVSLTIPVGDGTHACPSTGCPRILPFQTLACPRHWYALPPELRSALGRAWKAGDLGPYLALRARAVAILTALAEPLP